MSKITLKQNWEIISDNNPTELLVKSLILIDLNTISENNIIEEWIRLLLQKTDKLLFTESHIHTFSNISLLSTNKELKHHVSLQDEIAFNMLLTIIEIDSIAKNIVIVSSDEKCLSQLQKAIPLFSNINFFIVKDVNILKQIKS